MVPAEILVLDIQDTETVCTSDNNFSESAWNSSPPLFNFSTRSLTAMSSGDFVPGRTPKLCQRLALLNRLLIQTLGTYRQTEAIPVMTKKQRTDGPSWLFLQLRQVLMILLSLQTRYTVLKMTAQLAFHQSSCSHHSSTQGRLYLSLVCGSCFLSVLCVLHLVL